MKNNLSQISSPLLYLLLASSTLAYAVANLIQKPIIGEHALVGAGSTVVRNIPEKTLAFGMPCNVVRIIEIGEKLV